MPARKSRRSNEELKPPAVEEWDFSDCPDDELESCCYYEYSRERDDVKAQVAGLRDPNRQPHHPYPGDAVYYQNLWFTTFFRLFAEFPDTPWLKIPPGDRHARLKECAKWDSPFMSVGPERLQNDEDVYPYFPDDVGAFDVHSVHAVEVDWKASNDAIKKAFEQWLIENRPPYAVHLDQTGRVSDRELLKYLGAYRLLQDAENNWETANEWAAKFGQGTMWTPRYSDKRAWERPKRQAKEMINKGVTLTPAAFLIQKLDFSKLNRAEEARAKIMIGQMERAEVRKFDQEKLDARMAEVIRKVQQELGA
jgi:hypothetical protein